MRRREFINLVGGVAATLPFAARAQQAAMPVIGVLSNGAAADKRDYMAAFYSALKEAGSSKARMSRSRIAMRAMRSRRCPHSRRNSFGSASR
jgi:hypothetical protein